MPFNASNAKEDSHHKYNSFGFEISSMQHYFGYISLQKETQRRTSGVAKEELDDIQADFSQYLTGIFKLPICFFTHPHYILNHYKRNKENRRW